MEISNKTLAMVLVVAIAVSMFGTMVSLNRMQQQPQLTGFATDPQGIASVQVNSTASIRFSQNSVDWGSGSVNTSAGSPQNCTLSTRGAKSAGCNGFNNLTTGFVLENDGSTHMLIQINFSKNATDFIGGTFDYGGYLAFFNVSNNESASCLNLNRTYENWTMNNLTQINPLICDNLNFTDSKDELRIDILINIPYTSPAATKTVNVTATGTSV